MLNRGHFDGGIALPKHHGSKDKVSYTNIAKVNVRSSKIGLNVHCNGSVQRIEPLGMAGLAVTTALSSDRFILVNHNWKCNREPFFGKPVSLGIKNKTHLHNHKKGIVSQNVT